MMLIGAVADIHGDFDALHNAIERHPDVPFWLCVGDLASDSGAYPEPRARPQSAPGPQWDGVAGGPVVRLDRVSRSYVLIDAGSLHCRKCDNS